MIQKEKEYVIAIDAGHGGADPGKVGVNNALEKDINLSIAKKLREDLETENLKVVMIREKDEMFADENAQNKKREDMKKRVEMINKACPELTVSIHQNSFSDESVRGAQVFYYSASNEGRQAAVIMQKALRQLNAENTRREKANDDYYLLTRTEKPVIIVECGFLSNYEEAELLITDAYQEKVSAAICEGVLEYLGLK